MKKLFFCFIVLLLACCGPRKAAKSSSVEVSLPEQSVEQDSVSTAYKYIFFGKLGHLERTFQEDTLVIPPIEDLVHGSAYEFHNTKEYDFTLFLGNSAYTDDSIITMAVAYWLLKDKEHTYQGLEDIMVEFGHKCPCPMGGYGGGFHCWLFNPRELYAFDEQYGVSPYDFKTGRHPYGSYGNGSAM